MYCRKAGCGRERTHGALLVTLFFFFVAVFSLGRTAHCADRTHPYWPTGAIEWRSAYAVTGAVPGMAHLCATGPFTGYTAEHVVAALGEAAKWNYGASSSHFKVTQRFPKRDVVAILSDQPFPYYSPLADEAPAIGSSVWLKGFLWNRPGLITAYESRVLLIDHEDDLATEGPSMVGSSGSCVWDAAGRVLGIHIASAAYGPQGTAQIAVALHEPLWGNWREAK